MAEKATAAARSGPPPRTVLAGLLVTIAVIGVLARVQQTEAVAWIDGFHPDGEGNLIALLSGALLAAAAVAAVLVGERAPSARVRWRLLGAGLAALAVDEALGVHERLESVTGVDWQLLYLPVGAAGLWLAVSLLPSLRASGALPWVAGMPVAWVTAQVLEKLQWEGDVQVHPAMVVPEETLEMVGSALLLVGFYVALRATSAAVAEPGAPPPAGQLSLTGRR